jgi:hypothetical protein
MNDDMKRPSPPPFPATIEEALAIQRGFAHAPEAVRIPATNSTDTLAERQSQDRWRDTYGPVLARAGLSLVGMDVACAVVSCRACGREVARLSTAMGLSEAILCPAKCNQIFLEKMQRPGEL